MSRALEMQSRHAAALSQLAELGLALAADLQRRALASDDDAVAAQLADSFHKVGRSVRQTMALEARLAREHAAEVRAASDEDERTRPARIARRRAELSKAVERLIWTELEASEAIEEDGDDLMVGFLCDELMVDITDEEYAETSVPVLIARLKPLIGPALRKALEERDAEQAKPELRNSA